MDKKKVLVIGGGFGGVYAAKTLERQGRDKVEVELVNANNYFVFQPLSEAGQRLSAYGGPSSWRRTKPAWGR